MGTGRRTRFRGLYAITKRVTANYVITDNIKYNEGISYDRLYLNTINI